MLAIFVNSIAAGEQGMFSDLSIGECSGFTLPRHPKLQGIQDKSAFAGVGEEIDLDQRNRVRRHGGAVRPAGSWLINTRGEAREIRPPPLKSLPKRGVSPNNPIQIREAISGGRRTRWSRRLWGFRP